MRPTPRAAALLSLLVPLAALSCGGRSSLLLGTGGAGAGGASSTGGASSASASSASSSTSASSSIASTSSSASSWSSSSSSGGVCAPGSVESCYDGPPSTEGVGICHSGTRTCASTGTGWGPCDGEVLPEPPTCD